MIWIADRDVSVMMLCTEAVEGPSAIAKSKVLSFLFGL